MFCLCKKLFYWNWSFTEDEKLLKITDISVRFTEDYNLVHKSGTRLWATSDPELVDPKLNQIHEVIQVIYVNWGAIAPIWL